MAELVHDDSIVLLHLEIEGPDRKGRREVWFSCRSNRRGEPFVREVGAAL